MEISNIPEAFTLPLRLSLLSCLVKEKKNFNQIKNITNASDGNLSVQLSKLEKWGYIKSEKSLILKKQTVYYITEFGLNQLKEYVELLEKIISEQES